MSDNFLTGAPHAADQRAAGKDTDALGPSDSSDSGSDVQGERQMPTAPDNRGEWGALPADGGSDSDAMGTGERASASGTAAADGADILPDRVFDGAAPGDPDDLDAEGAAEVTGAAADDESDLAARRGGEDDDEDDQAADARLDDAAAGAGQASGTSPRRSSGRQNDPDTRAEPAADPNGGA